MKVLSNQSVFVDLSPCIETDTHGNTGQLLIQTTIKNLHVLSGRHGGGRSWGGAGGPSGGYED